MYHDLIFESAEFVFGEKGFDSATMQDIAQEAGVSLKTLYATFPGKQELYGEIQRERGGALVRLVSSRVESITDPLTALRTAARTHVEFLCEHPDWFRMHLQDRVPWAFRPKAERSAAYWEEGLGRLVEIVERGVAEGVFCDEDPWSLTLMMQLVIQVQVSRAVERDALDVHQVVREVDGPILRLLGVDRPKDLRALA